MKTNEIRSHFPIMKNRCYLFSGGIAPASYESLAATQQFMDDLSHDPKGIYTRFHDELVLVRRQLAQIIGADDDEIAVIDCTGTGSNLAVGMITPQPGSNVVFDEMSYPSSVYPWLVPDRSYVELRFVKRHDGVIRLQDLARVIDDHTIAVSITHVSELTGFRYDLTKVAQLAHTYGALLLVDAAQSAGAVQIDAHASDVDFLTCAAYKWLLGSTGVGFLYIAKRHLNRIPPHVGIMGVTSFARPFQQPIQLQLKSGAERFQVGVWNLMGVAATRPGLEMLLDVGMDQVEDYVLDLSGYCIEGLIKRDLKVITPREAEQRGGIISIEMADCVEANKFMRANSIDVHSAYTEQILGVYSHVFNNRDDIDKFLFTLDKYLAHR